MLQIAAPVAVQFSEEFQWAPTLGGECYLINNAVRFWDKIVFQWAPTLGGECYYLVPVRKHPHGAVSMGTHPWG